VIGGSVNETGTLLVEVTATGEDAFLNQAAREIEEARAMKPGIIQLADRVLKYFVPGVLTIAALSFAVWLVGPRLGAKRPARRVCQCWPSSSRIPLCAWDGDATGPSSGRRQGCQPRDPDAIR